MKNTLIPIILVVIVIGAISFWPKSSYSPTGNPPPSISPSPTAPLSNNEVTLAPGQKGKAGEVEVTFYKVIGDNRCPIEVTCITGGWVEASVELSQGGKTVTTNIRSGGQPAYDLNGWQVSIISATPATRVGKEIGESEYRLTFHVEAPGELFLDDELTP